jgi:hypothetical protein
MKHIYIQYPGQGVDLDDSQQASQIDNLFMLMNSQLLDAVISLNFFEEASNNLNRTLQLNKNIKRRNIKTPTPESDPKEEDNQDLYVLIKKYSSLGKKMEKGNRKTKWVYEIRLPFIYAHVFLYSLDNFGQLLNVIPSGQDLPQKIDTIRKDFNNKLPLLRQIRNSAHHIEDRIRRYGTPSQSKKCVKMNLQPVQNNILRGNFSAVIIGNLNGNKLSYTVNDGSYQEIEISIATLNIAVETLQNIINIFKWEGSPDYE